MSTTTTTTANYNQQGMNAYNSMMPGYASTVNSYMNNPFSNPFFQQQQQMGTNQANNMGQSAMSNLTGNLQASGIQQNSPAALQMMQQQQMNNSANRANLGFLAPTQNALTMQQSAMQQAGSFKPLQTGQTQTQGGVGSWLPQILGGALGAVTGGLLGGGGGPQQQSNAQIANVWNSGAMTNMQAPAFNSTNYSMGQNAPNVGSSSSIGGYNFASNPFLQ